MRRLLFLLVLAGSGVAATALAQGGGENPIPVVRSGEVLHLDSTRSCHGSPAVTLRVTPPSDVQIAWLAVRLDGRQIVRLTGIAGAASVSIRLPRGHSRVTSAGETLDGQQLYKARSYRSCIRRPSPPEPRREPPPVIIGGGEA